MSVTKTARGLEITYKKPKGAGLFLLMFSVFWNSVTCVALFAVMREMSCENLFGLLFLIPFVLVGAGTFAGAFYVLFGRMTLILTPGRGELFRGVGNLGRRQHFLLEKGSRISIEASSMRRNDEVLDKVVVGLPDGKTFEFGTGIEEVEAQQYIAALLRKMRGSAVFQQAGESVLEGRERGYGFPFPGRNGRKPFLLAKSMDSGQGFHLRHDSGNSGNEVF